MARLLAHHAAVFLAYQTAFSAVRLRLLDHGEADADALGALSLVALVAELPCLLFAVPGESPTR